MSFRHHSNSVFELQTTLNFCPTALLVNHLLKEFELCNITGGRLAVYYISKSSQENVKAKHVLFSKNAPRAKGDIPLGQIRNFVAK